MPYRRRSRFRRRPIRRRMMRRRSRFGSALSSVRRPTFARRLAAGNGKYALRVRRGGKAFPRVLGSGLNARAFKFSDTYMQIWGSNFDPSQPGQFANSILSIVPPDTTRVRSAQQLFDIEGGGLRELHKRATDRIVVKRLDLEFDVTLGEAAQSGAGRLTLIWDKYPLSSIPAWSDVFESAAAYPTWPAVQGILSGYAKFIDVNPSGKTDLSTYLAPDQRNRFEIIYQETIHLERGAATHSVDRTGCTLAPGTFDHYAGGVRSQAQISKSLYLNRMVTYYENSSGDGSGKWDATVNGIVWVFWQSTNTRVPSEVVAGVTKQNLDTECRLDLKCRTFFADLD